MRIRPQAINILMGEETPSYSFDRAGRMIGAFVGGVNYRRGLDNRVLSKWPGPEGRRRRWLTEAETRTFLTDAYTLAGEVVRACGATSLAVLQRWNWTTLREDATRFAEIYRPVSILPPDQYLALVLQATEGCSYNRCTFCDFYRDRPFRIKGPDDLRDHIRAVAEWLGPGLSLRKSLFLADANALVAPMARVRAWLDVIEGEQRAGVLPLGRIYSFIDAFDVHRKRVEEWQELAARGVRRLYIGMESGDDALLRFLRKPGTAADVVEAVSTLKAGGLSVSVIVMTGVGGDRFAESHVAETIRVLNAMPLGSGDIVYFSPFMDHAGSEYGRLAETAGVTALDGAAIAAQEETIRAGVQRKGPQPPPQYARYDIREFIY